jgi:lysylphosphatidylglycerol synthetase-like protein (DUF2156 family)
LGLRVWRSWHGHDLFHYTDVRGYRVTAGLPSAPPDRLAAFHQEFWSTCRNEGLRPLYFGLTDAATEFLPASSTQSTLARWHIGDLPLFDLTRWHDEALIPVAVRSQARRALRHGVVVEYWPTRPRPLEYQKLCEARNDWITAKPLPPLLFVTSPHVFDPWPREGVFVAKAQGRIVGFLVASRALFGDVFRIDVVARIPGAPNGTAELLVKDAFRHAAEQGVDRATLGLAPLSRQTNVEVKGWLRAVSGCARRIGGGWYSFAGLEAFKAKFQPDVWVPLYAVVPRRRFTPRDVLAIARVFMGGSLARYTIRFLALVLTKSLRTGTKDRR